MTPIEQLEYIVPALNHVVQHIWYGQLDAPTPCAKFSVHDVIDHMIVGGNTFAPLFRGEAPPEVSAPFVYGWVPATEFSATMNSLLAAVQSPGALERVIHSPFGEVSGDTFARLVAFDGLVHGWDLAQATGQVWAAFSRMAFSRSPSPAPSISRCTSMRSTWRGGGVMCFITRAVNPTNGMPLSRAAIPMMVIMQLAREEDKRSLGEKASPLPWLSNGASVITCFPLRTWVASVRRSPR